jgi:hypothetical protein
VRGDQLENSEQARVSAKRLEEFLIDSHHPPVVRGSQSVAELTA